MLTAAAAPNTLISERDALEPAERDAWRAMLRAHACLFKRLDAALEQAHRLPVTSYEVLQRLAEAPTGRMRMCDLAERAQISRSGLTRLVDRLERDGLLERCSCSNDGRGAFACLTHEGRDRLEAARATYVAVVRDQFLAHFSAEEISLLGRMWERIAPNGDC
jgi:DNA-binding MarR family transcriptional regulator